DRGTFASNRPHVLVAAGTFNVWRSLNIATVFTALSATPINETVGRDINADGVSNNDRPIRGIHDATMPIRSETDSQGRAVINGLEGFGSFTVDMSFRYGIPLTGNRSLDL